MKTPSREDALKALEGVNEVCCIEGIGKESDFKTLRSYIESHTGEAVAWRLKTVSGGFAFTEDKEYAAKCLN